MQDLMLTKPEWFVPPAEKAAFLRDLAVTLAVSVSVVYGNFLEDARRAEKRRREFQDRERDAERRRNREAKRLLHSLVKHPVDVFHEVKRGGKMRQVRGMSLSRYVHERGDQA